jgi:glycosyltransferase involved in cell wall biosynthesis
MRNEKVLIAIPAFNEEQTIAATLRFCRKEFPDADLLVVNDCSSDATLAIIESEEVNHLSLPFNLGVGGAMRAAFRFAYINDYSFLIQVDADGQHSPTEIITLFSKSKEFDVVIGSRFLRDDGYRINKARKFAIRVISNYLKFLIDLDLSDPTSGFRLSNRRAILIFSQTYPIEYLGDTVGSVVLGSLEGLRFGECSTPMRQRQGGKPSQNNGKSVIHLARTLLTITMMRLGKTSNTRGAR